MKKKVIISCSIAGGILALIIVLMFTLFGLSKISLDLRTYGSVFETKQEEVIKSGQFKYHTPIFFQSKKAYIDNLEKNNPYLKVVGIETKFPNKLIVKCVDREESFAVKISDNKYFILDEDLKLLKAVEAFDSSQENAILLGGEFTVLNTNAGLGDFISLSAGQALIENFVPALKVNNRTIAEQKALFQSVSLKYRINPLTAKSQAYLELTDFNGLKMSIMEAEEDLVLKINCLLASQAQMSPQDYTNYELKVLKNSNGEIFCLQAEKS